MNALKFTMSMLITIFAIVGGILVFLQTPSLGYRGLVLLVVLLIIIFVIKFISDILEPGKSPILIRTDFNSFLSKINLNKADYNKFNDLTKCALTLLLLDQSDSGTWSNSYLYRRIISQEGIPLSKGSLTGTPLALFSIFSLIERDDHDFIEYVSNNLAETLTKVIQPDGQYLRRYTIGQVGRVPELEPPRHCAGGLLCKILIGDVTELDKTTLKFLLNIKSHPNAWDKAIVIRTLTSIIYDNHFSIIDRLSSYLHRNKLINLLLEEAKLTRHQSLTWSHPYEYGQDITSQWGTIWALYPLLSDKLLLRKKRKYLQRILKNLIKSHISASLNKTSLLPRKIDSQTFRGKGEYVFSTVLAPVVYRALENYSAIKLSTENELTSVSLLRRIFQNANKIVKNPSESPNKDVQNLEGYFAWAGMCLTAASFGIIVDKTSTKLIVKLVKELKDIESDLSSKEIINTDIEQSLLKYNIFSKEFITPFKEAVANLLRYREVVNHAEEYKVC